MGHFDTLIRHDTLIFRALGLDRQRKDKEVKTHNVYQNQNRQTEYQTAKPDSILRGLQSE